MTIQANKNAYLVASGSGTIPFLVQEAANPTQYNINYPLYQMWINTSTGVQWQLTSFSSVGGTVTANWTELATSSSVVTSAQGTAPITVNATSGTPEVGALTVAITTPLAVQYGGTGDSTLTAHSLLVGEGTSAVTAIGSATNGQLPIGSTGANPVLATLTAGTGVSITNGAGSITIAASGTTTLTVTSVAHAASPYTVLSTDEFLAVNCSAGVVTVKLPNAPSTGRVYTVKDSNGNAATDNITVTTVGGSVDIDGATSYTMNVNYQAINVIFDGSAYEVY